METVVNAVSDGLSILGAVVSVYLALGIGLAFLEGQIDTVTGRPPAQDIVRRITLLVVCVALIAFARSVSDDVADLVGGELDSDQAVREAVLRIGQYFLDVVIGAAALLLAIGVAAGFVGAQLATMAGEALHLSNVLAKLSIVVALAVGAFLTISIANVIVGALR
jgi:hypothetical protein